MGTFEIACPLFISQEREYCGIAGTGGEKNRWSLLWVPLTLLTYEEDSAIFS